MLNRIISLKKEPLILGSLWLSLGGLFINLGNYGFNLLMGRYLTPGEYGTLVSLISLSLIISLPSAILTTITTKFSADFFAKKEEAKIARLMRKLTQYAVLVSSIIFILFILFKPFLQHFLKISDSRLIFLSGLIVVFSLILAINQGVYRGILFFKELTYLGLIIVFLKVALGWWFVTRNFSVFGALSAIFVANIVSWFFSFIPLKRYLKEKTKKSFGLRSKILTYTLPAFFITTAATLFLNSDLLLVKHFFTTKEAGIYAASSLMGKAIFYALAPISTVLFPLLSQKFSAGKEMKKELWLSLALTVSGGLIALTIYLLFPDFIVKVFFPSAAYVSSKSLIFLYGIFMFLYSLCFLLIQFFLAIEQNKTSFVVLLFSLFQILFIIYFHQNLGQVITVSIVTLFFLFLYLTFTVSKNWPKISLVLKKRP